MLIGGGIAQRTVFSGPSTQTANIEVDADAPYVVIDGDVMSMLTGTQTLRIEDTGSVFAAYGRTTDVDAWVARSEYTRVALDDDGAITSSLVEPEVVDEETDGSDDATTTPVGSDLWLDEFQQDGVVTTPLQIPSTMSVIIATDGQSPAPASVTVSWPLDNATPWAGPLIVLGGAFLGAGVILYVLGIRHARRSRGPRRKAPPPLAHTQPIDVAGDIESGSGKKGVISATGRRRSIGKRSLAAVPVLAVSVGLLAGCSAEAWPQLAPSPTPSPSTTVIDAEDQQLPAVTEAQAKAILVEISQTVAQADADMDSDLAATRLDGAALDVRDTNYTLRSQIADYATPDAIPTDPVSIILPQAYDGWPRTVMMVVGDEDDTDPAPTIMMMTQEDAWSQYKLTYIGGIEAATAMPDLAPTYVGAVQVRPDTSFLVISPDELPAAYADVLNNGEDSEYAVLFDDESDKFRQMIVDDRQKRLDEFNQTATDTGTLSFSAEAGENDPLALATLESGAIVAVDVSEVDTVKPTNSDAVIKLDNNPTVKTLSGSDESQSGFTTTFKDQLFFYVPGQGSTEKIRLLGYSSDILNAKVIQ
nr:glycosyl transferase [Microbacterium halimionae]